MSKQNNNNQDGNNKNSNPKPRPNSNGNIGDPNQSSENLRKGSEIPPRPPKPTKK